MAAGISTYLANALLNAALRNTSLVVAQGYVQLHTGAPGAAGTANVATDTRRVAATFGTAAAGGSITNTADLVWASIVGSQTPTFFSLWDASTAGNFLLSGTISGNPYNAGDTVTLTSGSLVVSLTVAS